MKHKQLRSLLLAACLLLAGCGGPSGGQAGGAAGQAAAGPSGGNDIIRSAWSDPPVIDPARGSDQGSNVALCNLYDSLVFTNLENEIEPMLAESWEYSYDGLEWTFHLRKDVQFHNGDAFTADDVVFSFNRLITIGEGHAYLLADRVRGCEKVDDYTVKFTLKENFAPFLSIMVRLYIVNEGQILANKKDGSYGEFGDYGTDYLLTNDAGSGAYQVEEMRISDRLIMTKFDGYWGEFSSNPPKRVELIGNTEAATIRTWMSNNELEISDTWQTTETINFLSSLPGMEQGILYLGAASYGMLNQQLPPMDDVHVRKAMAYMLDDAAVTEQIFPNCKQLDSCVPRGVAGYYDGLEKYEYSLEKAKAELEQSKYAGQFGQYPITINTFSEVPDSEKIALLYQATGEGLGLEIRVEPIPWMSFVERIGKVETTAHMTICVVPTDFAEAGSLLMTRFHTSMNGSWQQGEWMQDKELDRMIEGSMATLDYGQRMQKYADIQAYIAENCYTVNIYDEGVRFVYRADLFDFPAVDNAKADKPVSQTSGYNFVFKDFTMK